MLKGNLSKLAKSEVCQKCAKCCKVFESTFNMDMAVRLIWMHDEQIEGKDTPFCWGDGVAQKMIIFHKGCKQLGVKNGTYFCKKYDEDRPDFCCTYPDNTFQGIESWNTQKIQKQIDENKKICPLFETITVEEVVAKLYNEEGYWIFPVEQK